jgi:hypothetical protein
MLGKIILGISALVFISYGVVSLLFPAIPSGLAGLEMSNGDAIAEIGAMYGGLQSGIGMFCLLALLKREFYKSGLVLLTLSIGSLAAARLFSLLMTTEAISAYSYGALVYEFSTTVIASMALMGKNNDPT